MPKFILQNGIKYLAFILFISSCNLFENEVLTSENYAYSLSYDIEEYSFHRVLEGKASYVDHEMQRPMVTRQHVTYKIAEDGEMYYLSQEQKPQINENLTPYPQPEDLIHITKVEMKNGVRRSYDRSGKLIFETEASFPNQSESLQSLRSGEKIDLNDVVTIFSSQPLQPNLRSDAGLEINYHSNHRKSIKGRLPVDYPLFGNMELHIMTDTLRNRMLGYMIYDASGEAVVKQIRKYDNDEDELPGFSSYEVIEKKDQKRVYSQYITYLENVSIQRN